MNLIALLIFLLIICAVIWAARAILTAFSIGEPITTVVMVIIVLIALLSILGQLGYAPAGGLRLCP